jgi:threonylcarbamoyladenosine tRNA methylthiotransferase MtaB
MKRFFIQNFGCRATQADGAALQGLLERQGLAEAGEAQTADLVILNTCTVTAAADDDVRKSIHRVHRENPDARILVTGCYAQRAPEELALIPGVDWVVGNSHKTRIPELISLTPATVREWFPSKAEPPAIRTPARHTTGKSTSATSLNPPSFCRPR